jgi:hypothetical protein
MAWGVFTVVGPVRVLLYRHPGRIMDGVEE